MSEPTSQSPLVEPEGVNAGSAEEVDEAARPAPPERTRAGGQPQRGPADDVASAGPRLVGTPEPQTESAQDDGSLS